jgi:hypothetical protein
MMRRCVCGGALGIALGFGWQAVSRKNQGPVCTVWEVESSLQLLRERAELDPDSAWSVQLLGDEVSRVDMLYSLAEIDTKADQLVARLLSLEEIDDWTLRNSARRALLGALIESDPQGTFERCLTLGDVDLRR